MSTKSQDEPHGYGNWIFEHQRVWWPIFTILFMSGIWVVGMGILGVFPALGDKSIGHVTGYGEKCDTDSNGVTSCDPYSIITFSDIEQRTHWTSGDADLPLEKEMLVNYLPWGNPPIAAFTFDVSVGEEPRGFLSTGILLFIIIILMSGLVWATLAPFFRNRRRLTEAQQVAWWSVYIDIPVGENDPVLRKVSNRLQFGETINQIYRINPFQFAMKSQPDKLDTYGLAIGGLIWYGLSIALNLGSTGWPLSLKSWILNTGISLIGLVMLLPFAVEVFLGISSRLIVTNLRKILFIGNRCLSYTPEQLDKEQHLVVC